MRYLLAYLPFPTKTTAARSSTSISIVDDNAKGHQNPNTFVIVHAHTNKKCCDHDVGQLRWKSCVEQFSTCAAAAVATKTQHKPSLATSSSSSACYLPKLAQPNSSQRVSEIPQPQRPQDKKRSSHRMPKLPQRKTSSEGREQPQQEMVFPTTSSSRSSSINGSSTSRISNPARVDMPLRKPTRQSSLVCLFELHGQSRPPPPFQLDPEASAASAETSAALEQSPQKQPQDHLPKLILWSRSPTTRRHRPKDATMKHQNLLRIPAPPSPCRPKQVSSKTA